MIQLRSFHFFLVSSHFGLYFWLLVVYDNIILWKAQGISTSAA